MLDITTVIVNVMGNASKTDNRDSSRMIKAIQVGGAAIDNFTLACISRKYAAIEMCIKNFGSTPSIKVDLIMIVYKAQQPTCGVLRY